MSALLLVLAAGAMAALTWRGWLDPFVDFGRELYVPWRLSVGERLYTDVAWFNGPLSAHFNALLFRLFEPGLIVLASANAAVFGLVVAMLYDLGAKISDHAAALAGCLVLILVFGFGQYVGIGNFNWITPYSHELTHGVALALAAVWTLDRWHRTGARVWSVLSGLSLGLCFLTKPEAFTAAAAGSAVLLAGLVRSRDPSLGLWVTGALVPPAVSAATVGWAGTLGGWPSVLGGEVAALAFYRAGMGLDDPTLRLEETLSWAAVWLIVLLVPTAAAWLARETRTPWATAIGFGVTAGVLGLAGDAVPWMEALRPLQVAMAAIVGMLFMGRMRATAPRTAPPTALALAVLALALLAKMALNVRGEHYGFALAAPATVVLVIALVGWLPDELDRRSIRGGVVRGSVLAILSFFCVGHVSETASRMEQKTQAVGSGVDAFRSDIRGAWIVMAVNHLRASGVRSVAVVPEGALINYLARIPNPTPFINFLPPEAILFGEDSWESSFRGSPPDAIVMIPRDTGEFGRGPFGYGYGVGLAKWIDEEYVVDAVLSLEDYTFGVEVLLSRDRDLQPPRQSAPRGPSIR